MLEATRAHLLTHPDLNVVVVCLPRTGRFRGEAQIKVLWVQVIGDHRDGLSRVGNVEVMFTHWTIESTFGSQKSRGFYSGRTGVTAAELNFNASCELLVAQLLGTTAASKPGGQLLERGAGGGLGSAHPAQGIRI